MNILVIIKKVPDTEAKILSESKVSINTESIKWVISDYDEIALEEALRIKEKNNDAKVTVLSVGQADAVSAIKTAYAMGADDGVLLECDNYEMLDSCLIADIIYEYVKDKDFHVIFAGRQATDSDNGQVPIILSKKLNYPIFTFTDEVILKDNNSIEAKCEVEGGECIYEAKLPVIITANDRLNEPRYPSLKGIMASKKKPVTTVKVSDLPIENSKKVEVLELFAPIHRGSGEIIEAEDTEEKANKLVHALQKEAKVI